MEDEILLKRNTDCVYFLASPLTCNKGVECEYRHSETARLNPRDCWYWLSGSCINPTCAFRHPPLDGRPETSVEPASLPNQASVSVSKTNVPCYFYFNGFCNKGNSCSFMHGTHGVTPTWKFSKSTSAVTSAHVDNKTLAKGDRVAISIEEPPKPSETRVMEAENVQVQSKVDLQPPVSSYALQPPVSSYALQQSASLHMSFPECEGAVLKSETQLPAEDFVDGRPILCGEQSSEDQVEDHIEPEERWESSPGFDVLVDDGSENLGYEDDAEYLLAQDTEAGRLHDHLLLYDYDEAARYDHLEYPDSTLLYEHGIYDSYDVLEKDHISEYIQRVPKRSREMLLDPMMFQKGNYLSREVELNDRKDLDLRHHLRKRRKIPGRPRRRGLTHMNDGRQEQLGRRGRRPPHRRLALEVGSNMNGAHSDDEARLQDNYRRGWPRYSQPKRIGSRHYERERRRQARPKLIFSEISRDGMSSQEMRPMQELAKFTGPKTLAQIKEEKSKAKENENSLTTQTHYGRTASENFEGPKPLSEILKEKRRFGSMSDNTDGRHMHDNAEPETNHVNFDKDTNGVVDDDDDEDALEKKLAGIMG